MCDLTEDKGFPGGSDGGSDGWGTAGRPKTQGGLSVYACGQFSRWVWAQCPTRTHAGTKTLSQPSYFKAVRSHSSSTWLSALIALGRRNQSSYFCTGFPGTVPFPGLQLCKRSLPKPDAAEFQDGFPLDMLNLKSQLPSHLRFPRLLLGKD